MPSPGRERVSLRFGSSSFPVANRQSKRNAHAKVPQRQADRPHVLAYRAGSADSSDQEASEHGRHELITGFGADGAETREGRKRHESRAVLVIPRQANRDWRCQLRSRTQDKTLVGETQSTEGDGETIWGLGISSAKPTENENTGNKQRRSSLESHQPWPHTGLVEDAEALEALLGQSSSQKKTIMPTHKPLSEDDAYRRDAANVGAVSTMADYEAMPVEEFGAALLRGMGWNGEALGPKIKEARRRANHLGLGAKELREAEDLGGWNQDGTKKKRLRLDEYRSYKDRQRDRLRDQQQERRAHKIRYRRELESEPEKGERLGGRHRQHHDDYDRDDRRQ